MSANGKPRLIFEGGFSERDAFEAKASGYRSHVWAELPCGDRYPLVFYDPVRLSQDLEEESRAGTAFIGEPGLVVIPEVTRELMEAAVYRLHQEGYFDAFKSVELALDATQ